ncbi:MAG: Asp23/Gls24 family envelope stress response protein [Enterococcus sp.]|nr:Asp23/Gls24 family envelope stress response protein [Enterococcus dispar]MCU7358186.1 Asp23/Gls24 family envelope stress response protein [Enterococcus dispar]MDT2705704.1 Asp23/Gls24 family envelope stress response protein [Enterococcus dispar]WCG34392.1 Asp23/Gls24 family envelope stress response protein [Enterococcus dispar]
MKPETKPVPPKPPVGKAEGIKGELTFDDKVVEKIIGIALDEIGGLLTVDGGFFSNIAGKLVNTDNPTSGIDVEVGKKQVAVDLSIVAEYGKDITTIYNQIKEVIAREVKKMTGLDVIEVNVDVVDVKTKAQHEKDSVTVQDQLSDAASATGDFASKQTEKAKEALGKAGDKVSDGAHDVKENVQEAREPRVE